MSLYAEEVAHVTAWRAKHLPECKEQGWQNGVRRPHILPRKEWLLNLWPGIRESLPAYLKEYDVQHHTGAHNLLSSWVTCANLYFPVYDNPDLKGVMAEFLASKVSPRIRSVCKVELEFAFKSDDLEHPGLHPSILLGEKGGGRGSGQTSPDVAFLVETDTGDGLVLTECKYTEHHFYRCSARVRKGDEGRPDNPDPSRCRQRRDDYNSICHHKEWERRYWDHLKLSDTGRQVLKSCPAATDGYQLFRQQALAEGIAASGYDFVASCVAYDGRNEELVGCLRTTGIDDFTKGWGEIFEGRTQFSTWTHQEWVAYLRGRAGTKAPQGWIEYLSERYRY